MTSEEKIIKLEKLFKDNRETLDFAMNVQSGRVSKLLHEAWKIIRPEMERK